MTRLEQFDLTPFNRATIGFEKLFNEIDRQFSNSNTGYPPYNIVEINENEWMISLAVAGFGMDNLEITQDKNTLSIEGKTPYSNTKYPFKTEHEDDIKYLHKGIGMRNFRRQFTLADHVEVKTAKLDLGILNIHLVRNVPEELLPRKIEISETTVDKS